jgi:ATP-binding cassette subfamily F protein 3
VFSVQQLGHHFTGEFLFRNVSFQINDKDRIGLIGKNGAGKSTLLKMLSGITEPKEGSIAVPEHKIIGYLPQEMDLNDHLTIWEETLTAFDRIDQIEAEIASKTNELSERTDYESKAYSRLIEDLNQLNEQFELLGGNQRDGDSEKVLLGLGFERKQFQQQTSTLSGGWRMRIELAKILLQQPDLLLLDEPTNHLDIESIRWFEQFLQTYNGAVVLVSHDRRFLDQVTKRTIEISLGSIRDYKYSYSDYVQVREQELETQKAAYDNQQQQIKQTEQFIERFRYKATKSRQVQSRIKLLEKMDKVELDQNDVSKIHFSFPPAPHSGKLTLEIEEYGKAYGDHQVLKNVDLILPKGTFIAFVGKNGEGKSTLAKSILKEIDYDGEIKYGHQVEIGYYAQNQSDHLDENKTVFESLDDIAVGDIRKRVRDILGSFLFSGEDLDKKVKVLSGGERARLALAILLLKPVNLLILDEPTNHLDMISKDILKNALLKYDGTLILISHDRDFLTGLSEKTYEFKNGGIKEHIGDINDFLETRKLEDLKALEALKKEKGQQQKSVSDQKLKYEERKQKEREKRKVERRIEELEKMINEHESAIEIMDEQMAQPKEGMDYNEIYGKYNTLKEELDSFMKEWEEKSEQVELMQMEIEELK